MLSTESAHCFQFCDDWATAAGIVVFQGILIAIIKPARLEMPRLRRNNVRGKFEHILGNLLIA